MSIVTKIICVIIFLEIPCYALDTKQHYYFDTIEKKYHYLNSNLSLAKKQFLNQKIEAEISLVKKSATANNLVLILTSALSTIGCANAIQVFRLRNNANPHDLHIGIMLTGIFALIAIRSYTFKNEITKKITKLAFKKSLLNN